jgi:hypothetical protein
MAASREGLNSTELVRTENVYIFKLFDHVILSALDMDNIT